MVVCDTKSRAVPQRGSVEDLDGQIDAPAIRSGRQRGSFVTSMTPSTFGCALPLLELEQQTGLSRLLDRHVRVTTNGSSPARANATPKLSSIVAGMAAGADGIDDLDVPRRRDETALRPESREVTLSCVDGTVTSPLVRAVFDRS
jgi:hypothetical protein